MRVGQDYRRDEWLAQHIVQRRRRGSFDMQPSSAFPNCFRRPAGGHNRAHDADVPGMAAPHFTPASNIRG